jgi:hypothetical protein
VLAKIRRFGEQVAANVAAAGVAALVLLAAAALYAFGSKSVTVEGWQVVLLIVVLLALIGGEILLYRRGSGANRTPAAAERRHYEGLLSRLERLEDELVEGSSPVPWAVASVYNDLRGRAINECRPTIALQNVPAIQAEDRQLYGLIDRPGLRALVAQVRAIVEQDETSPARETDVQFY